VLQGVSSLESEGSLIVDLSLSGPTSDLAAEGYIAVTNGYFKAPELPEAVSHVQFRADITPKKVSIPTLSLKFGQSPVTISGEILDYTDSIPTIDFILKSNMDLAEISRSVALPESTSLQGSLQAEMLAKGPLDMASPEKLQVQGTIDIQKGLISAPPLLAPLATELIIRIDNQVVSVTADGTLANTSYDFSAKLSEWFGLLSPQKHTPSLNFTLAADTVIVQNIIVLAPADTTASDTSLEQQPLLIAPLAPFSGTGEITIGSFTYQTATLNGVKTKLKFDRGSIASTTTSGFAGGSISHDFSATVSNEQTASISNQLDVTKIEIHTLINNLNNLIPPSNPLLRSMRNTDDIVQGSATFRSNLSSTGSTLDDIINALQGTLHLTSYEGVVQGGPIVEAISEKMAKIYTMQNLPYSKVKGDLRIENEKVYFDSLDIESAKFGYFVAHGNVGFDASLDFDLLNRLTPQLSEPVLGAQQKVKEAGKQTLLQFAEKFGVEKQADQFIDKTGIKADSYGRVTFALPVTGTATAPRVGLPRFSSPIGGGSKPSETPRQDSEQKTIVEQAKKAIKNPGELIDSTLKKESEAVKDKVDKQIEKAKEQSKDILKKLPF